MDVSTLLGPDLFKTKTGSSSRDSLSTNSRHRPSTSLGSNSNDSSSTLAPPTPGTLPSDGSGSSETASDDSSSGDEEDPAADYADTDDEADIPLPLFLVRDGQADDVLGTVADEDDLAWADVPPPSSLTEIPSLPGGGDVPELLREIVASSLESVQAQLAVAVAEKTERDRQKAAEAAAAAAARAEAKRQKQEQLEKERREAAALAKGKARDTATRHIPDPIEHRPSAVQPTTGPIKKSRRHMFASRVLRHVHILGGANNERGESSAAGAAAAAEAAQAAEARAALQRAYEQAQMRAFGDTTSSGSSSSKPVITRKPVKKLADKVAGPPRQQAYEQAMLRALEGTASSSTAEVVTETASTTTTTAPPATTLPSTQPIPTQRRAAMLLAMVRKDMEKKKEPVPPATM